MYQKLSTELRAVTTANCRGCSEVTKEYAVPGPVRQLVAEETLAKGGSGVGVLDGVGVSVIVGVNVGVGLGVGVDVIGGRLANASTVLTTAVSNKSLSLGVDAEQAARTDKLAIEMRAVRKPITSNSAREPRESGGV